MALPHLSLQHTVIVAIDTWFSPNPASSEVTVTAPDTITATKAGTAAITEINIYDQL
ncbi:MAG: hypothetical protein WKG06_19280 [Segetibacter sp.]